MTVARTGPRDAVRAAPGEARERAGSAPHLMFCCELSADRLTALFADPPVLADLLALRAGVSLALPDLSGERAAVVRRLNEAGVPVTAWLLLPEADGYFCNLDNAPRAAARYAAFRAWAAEHDLRFSGVALDLEPDVRELRCFATGEGWSVARLWQR